MSSGISVVHGTGAHSRLSQDSTIGFQVFDLLVQIF